MKTSLGRRSVCHAIVIVCVILRFAAATDAEAQVESAAPQLPDATADAAVTTRIFVTGSNIPRSETESALPVQVITRADIERGGSTSLAELMSRVSANVLGFSDQLSLTIESNPGARPRPGLSSVNLRGVGDGSTLILINGLRVANYAFDGGAVDINAIPLAAIDRVEILKDGASAIYGADAIAGVVNIILRKDFHGVEATTFGSATQHGGGNQFQATASAGYGDLNADKFNAFVLFNYQKDAALYASQRAFSQSSYRPADGLSNISTVGFPANILGSVTALSPGYATGCAPPSSFRVPGTLTCAYDPAAAAEILPASERTSAFGRVTFRVGPDLQLFAEAGYAQTKLTLSIQPEALRREFTSDDQPVAYPAGGPFYPTAFAAANGLSGNLDLLYRTTVLGNRINDVDTKALRAVVGATGVQNAWDYSAAVVFTQNRESDDFASGYISERRFLDALATGLINPFGPSGPVGDALLASTEVSGPIHQATGSTVLADAKASRDIYRLPGGPLGIAIGAETRRETLDNVFSALANSGDVVDAGGAHGSVGAGRTVQAVYVEASAPFAKEFESQLAARYDHYSDFGNTVNPKAALRWQPTRALMLRTSWGTGFRAPTLYDLYTPVQQTFLVGAADPVRCPVTRQDSDCAGDFRAQVGGNPNLKPEKSEQFNAGRVWDAARGLSLTVDYWKINKRSAIGVLDESALFDPASYDQLAPAHITRAPPDAAYPNLPGPITLVDLRNTNLGDLRTSGFDIDISWLHAGKRPWGNSAIGLR